MPHPYHVYVYFYSDELGYGTEDRSLQRWKDHCPLSVNVIQAA